jgi:polar amino acid transport system substrate-binding protein
MKYVFWVCSFLFCLTAQAHNPALQQVTNITVAAPEIRPFIYKNEKGENDGLLIDTIKKLNNNGKFNISVEIMPWARALKEVKDGRFDALMPTVYSPERTLFLSFPEVPLINFYGSEIYKRVNDSFIYQSIPLIDRNKTIVKVRSTSFDLELEKVFSEASFTFVEATRLEDAFNMLLYGHVDLLVADSAIANTTIKNMAINKRVKGYSLTDEAHSSFLAFSKNFAKTQNINDLMNQINLINDPDSYHLLSK